MTNNSNDKIEKTKGHANIVIPELFLFSDYMKNGEPTRENISPIQNQLIYVGKKGCKDIDSDNPPVLKTDDKGQLYHFGGERKTEIKLRAPYRGGNIKGFSLVNNLDIIIPPVDMVCRSAAPGGDWLNTFSKSMQEMQQTISANKDSDSVNNSDIPQLELTTIKKSQLRRPSDQPSDAAYKQWHSTLIRDSVIHGYLLPRTRAIFFVFNLDILNTYAGGSQIEVFLPTGGKEILAGNKIQKVSTDNESNKTSILYIVPLTGTDKTLPAGRYKITVLSPKNSADAKKWNGRVAGNDKLKIDPEDSYSLSFNVKFNIQNTAGEFSIINADPISLEEALVKQYPHYYNYLLHNALTDMHPDLKQKKADDASKPPAAPNNNHTFTPMINMWKTTTGIADFTNKTFSAKSAPEVLSLITNAIHKKFTTQENVKLRQSLDLVFQTQATLKAWGDLRGSANDLLEILDSSFDPTNMRTLDVLKKIILGHSAGDRADAANEIREIARNTPWFGDPSTLNADYEESLGKFLGLSQETSAFMGKAMDVVDIATSFISLVDSCLSWRMAEENLDTNKGVLDALTGQYLEFIKKKPITKQVNLDVHFESGKYDIRPQDEDYLHNTILEHLKDNKNEITINGYTDSVGSEGDNDTLSENRAQAIKNWLVNPGGMDESLISIKGWGETNLKEEDPKSTDGYSNKANRRCTAEISTQIYSDGAPCREAINTLEKSRYMTVTQKMQVAKAIVTMMESAADFALAIAPVVFPACALACTAISLAKESVALAKTVDQFAFDGELGKLVGGDQMALNLLFESYSNQTLIRDLYNEHIEDGNISETKLSSLQLRLRAEAIGGMLRLIIRARASSKNDKEFDEQIEKYKLDKYIENFILNDGWSMPMRPPIAISMDEFWLFAINEFNKDKTSVNPVEHFGLDENYGVMNILPIVKKISANLKPISPAVSDAITIADNARMWVKSNGQMKGVVINNMYMMSITGKVPHHVESSFQDQYPVHYFAAGTNNYKDFAKDFNPSFEGLKNDIYEHMAIYSQETKFCDNSPPDIETKWNPIAQNELDYYSDNKATVSNPIITNKAVDRAVDDDFGLWTSICNRNLSYNPIARLFDKDDKRLFSQKAISPVTPVKVLIVFKNKSDNDGKIVNGITPVSIALTRYDNILTIDGPVYKTLAKKLTMEDLEDLNDLTPKQKQKITGTTDDGSIDSENSGMYGCIFHPFFQFGNITHAGLKPASTADSDRGVLREANQGGFTDMKYGFICKVGNEKATRVKVPFSTKKYWNGADDFDSFDDEITVTLDSDNKDQKKLLHKGFLRNNSLGNKYPEFFKNAHTWGYNTLCVAPFIRIGGPNKHFLPPFPLESEIDEYNKLPANGVKLKKVSDGDGYLEINNFDWKTSVDFVFTLACTAPQIEAYTDLEADHLTITGETCLVNTGDFISNVNGTKIQNMDMIPIGILSIVKMVKLKHGNYDDTYINTAKKIAANRINKVKDQHKLSDQEKKYCIEPNKSGIYVYVFTKSIQKKNTSEISAFLDNIDTTNDKYELHSSTKPNLFGNPPSEIKILTPYRHLEKMVHHDTANNYHIFAASKSMFYKHPLTSGIIESIRPFGETDGVIDQYYEYCFKKFSTSGRSSGGKPINFGDQPPFRFRADKAVEALKPSDNFLNDYKKDHKDESLDWKSKIKDWIENKPTADNGPKGLWE